MCAQTQPIRSPREALDRVINSRPGFVSLVEDDSHWDFCVQAGRELQQKYKKLCIVGMGGSCLGIKSLWQFLGESSGGCRLHFFDTTDPREMQSSLERLSDLESTGWLFISKSGQTMETLAMANYVHQFLKSRKLNLVENSCVLVADLSSSLAQWAAQNQMDIYPLPQSVCGRFSVLTTGGLIPAMASGIPIEGLQAGAAQRLQNLNLVVQWAEQSLDSFQRGEWIHLFWSYSRRLRFFTHWFQQLWCESLVKAQDKHGNPPPQVSSVLTCMGPEDQHSLLQEVVEGVRNKFVWFFRDEELEKKGDILKESLFKEQNSLVGHSLGDLTACLADGTQRSLTEAGVFHHTVKVQPQASSMGDLILSCELLVATLADCFDIDAYNQPGVEASKRIASQLIYDLS